MCPFLVCVYQALPLSCGPFSNTHTHSHAEKKKMSGFSYIVFSIAGKELCILLYTYDTVLYKLHPTTALK